jgi:hypothetical protein
VATDGDDAAEIERLRQERDQLQEEVERIQGVKRHRLRAVAAAVAVVVAVASFSLALPGAWARRTVADADTYLAVVGPLASDPAVQEALAREITTAVFEALDIQGKLTAVLTDKAPQLTFLAGPIANSVQGFVQDQVLKIVASPQFQQFWTDANRLVQAQVIAVLQGKSTTDSGLSIQGDTVVLNFLPLVNQALQAASATISQLLGRPLTLPEITPDMVPADVIQRLDTALGVTLPTDFGTLVVFKSDQLPNLQYAVNTARQGLIGLVVLFVLAIAIALWASPRRRRTILQLAVAIAVMTVIERRIGISSVDSVVNIAKPENQAAVRAIAEALVGWFLDYTRTFLLLALLVVVVALLTGPYGWVVAFRRGVGDLSRNAVHTDGSVEAGPTATWVAAHRMPVMTAIGFLAVAILWLFELTVGWAFLVLLVAAVLEFVAWRVLRPTTEEPAMA